MSTRPYYGPRSAQWQGTWQTSWPQAWATARSWSTATRSDLRIGDAEREQAVTALGEHYFAGRLTKEEYDERTEAAWSARTYGQLSPLFVDLPAQAAVASDDVVATPRKKGHGVPILPIALMIVAVFAFTPLHLPWFGWLLFFFLWWSGILGRVVRRTRRW